MSTKWKKLVIVGLMAMGTACTPIRSWADPDYPVYNGGNFGIGVELGDPGTWGISGKLWADDVNAFAPAVKFNDGGPAILQLDYLWHDFDIVHLSHGGMPFYIGLGGNLLLTPTVEFAGRLPIGVSLIIDRRHVPIEFYFQVVPTLWFDGGTTAFDLYPEGGVHLYL